MAAARKTLARVTRKRGHKGGLLPFLRNILALRYLFGRNPYKMPQNCCVPNCTKKLYQEKGKKISFHKFPNDKKILTAWIRAIRRDVGRHFKITEHTGVFSKHFNDADFQMTLAGRRILCSTAIPSIFSWKKDSPKKRKPPKAGIQALTLTTKSFKLNRATVLTIHSELLKSRPKSMTILKMTGQPRKKKTSQN